MIATSAGKDNQAFHHQPATHKDSTTSGHSYLEVSPDVPARPPDTLNDTYTALRLSQVAEDDSKYEEPRPDFQPSQVADDGKYQEPRPEFQPSKVPK